jgi:hypothetical protein
MLISYESLKAGNVQVAIIDIQARFAPANQNSQNGTNHNNLCITIAQRIYICCLQNGDKLETINL